MNSIELTPDQIVRIEKYPAPNVVGYDSLYFHALTSGNETKVLYTWGNELTAICEEENIEYYHFFNDFGTKINVYPNDLIEEWWANR
jgi:hypothetical protein